MGSSSSKRQYYQYPYTDQPVSAPYSYPVEGDGQFGYYIQQVGSEPSQVQAIPGYYYHPGDQRVRSRTSHKRQNSAPLPSNRSPSQPQLNGEESTGASSEEATSPTSAPAPESAAEPPAAQAAPEVPISETPAEAPAEALAEAPADAKPTNGPVSQPAAPLTSEPDQSILTNPLPNLSNNAQYANPYRRSRRTPKGGSPGVVGYYAVPVASVAYRPQLRSQYRSYSKTKDPILRPPRPHEELKREAERSNSITRGPFTRLRSFTMPSLSRITSKKSSRSPVTAHTISYPYPYATAPGSRGPIPTFLPAAPAPPVPSGPPIVIPLNSSLNPTSRHRILYKKRLYPTAAHLFEAHKFLKHKPELAERIRTSSEYAAEMDVLSKAFERDGFVRSDWALVWRDKMDDVLYLKFVQHPNIRAELMATGYSPLLDGNEPRRPDAEGVNELGKALVRLRERLRREGAR